MRFSGIWVLPTVTQTQINCCNSFLLIFDPLLSKLYKAPVHVIAWSDSIDNFIGITKFIIFLLSICGDCHNS